MRIFRSAVWLVFLLAAARGAWADELLCSFSDPAGDRDVTYDLPVVAIDVVRVDLSFDNATGDFRATVVADPVRSFSGHFIIALHIVNPDAQTTASANSALNVTLELTLNSSQQRLTYSGNYPGLIGWKPGQRAVIGAASLGKRTDARISPFGSGVGRIKENGKELGSIDFIGDADGNGRSSAVAMIERKPIPPPRVTRSRRSRSVELEDVLAVGIPVVAAIGVLIFLVRTIQCARHAPLRERTLAIGLLSISLSLFALGCSAIPFVSPRICAVPALGMGAIGVALAFVGIRQSEQVSTVGACYAGLVANAGVTLLALTLFMPNTKHVIDRVERSFVLSLVVESGVLCSVVAIVAIRIWLWLSLRTGAEHRFHFGLSSLMLSCGTIPIWLWLSLVTPIPEMLPRRSVRPHSLSEVIDMFTDLINFGALSTFNGLITPFVLYAVTVAIHPLISRRYDSWPLSAFLAGLIVAVIPLGMTSFPVAGAVLAPVIVDATRSKFGSNIESRLSASFRLAATVGNRCTCEQFHA